jgi:hypothetical protein
MALRSVGNGALRDAPSLRYVAELFTDAPHLLELGFLDVGEEQRELLELPPRELLVGRLLHVLRADLLARLLLKPCADGREVGRSSKLL